jgi:hypothetical protein
MRIITRRQIYRAFPELDAFSDERCEEFLRRVHLSFSRRLIIKVAPPVIGFASFFVTAWAALALLRGVRLPQVQVELYVNGFGWVYETLRTGVFFAALAPPFLLGLLTRDLTLGAFLKRALRGRLKRTACPGCGYQLLGLGVDEQGVVRCPECGRNTRLGELGLDGPEDLLPDLAEDQVS